MKLTDQEITLMQNLLVEHDGWLCSHIDDLKPYVPKYYAKADKNDNSESSKASFQNLNEVRDELRRLRKDRKMIVELNKKLKQQRKDNQRGESWELPSARFLKNQEWIVDTDDVIHGI